MAAKAGPITIGSESQGLTALAQTIIGGKPVFLRGAKFTNQEVEAVVAQKRTQLRSNVFLLSHVDVGAQDRVFKGFGEETRAVARDLVEYSNDLHGTAGGDKQQAPSHYSHAYIP